MASNPPGKCCGTVHARHEGDALGKMETLNGVETYVARPSDKVHNGIGILFLTDVLGHKLHNAQLLADQFAANGYLTIMPNIIHNDPVPTENAPKDFDIMKWFVGEAPHGKVSHTPDTVFPVVNAAVEWLRGEGGIKKLGAVGYCYGAKYVTVAMGEGKVDVGYVAHPSFVDEAELAAIKGPYSIAAAETDHIFPVEKRHKSEEILRETKQPYQITLYSGVEHGFAVKGDLSKPAVKFGKEQAFLQAVHWFDQWLL